MGLKAKKVRHEPGVSAFQANGVPTTGTTVVTFTDSTISINSQSLPVTNAPIAFSPNYTCLFRRRLIRWPRALPGR
jgi:hypothetical protein